MAKKPTAAKAATVAINVAVLALIVAGTQSELGYAYAKTEDTTPMIAQGLVEVNATLSDEQGGFATRATQAGIDYLASVQPAAPAAGFAASAPVAAAETVAKVRPSFSIDKGVPVPATRRFGSNPGIYPFDTMEVSDSFFVPATEDRPNVAKSMASTISSANKRYKESGKKFSVRNVEADVVTGVAGARVFRVA